MNKMENNKMNETIKKVEDLISKIDSKNNHIYFFVLDTKGNPNGLTEYEYRMAYSLKEMGYNVTMLHQEKEFVGVSEWLGEKFSSLEHKNVEEGNVSIEPCDFIFIPEVFANVMSQTKSLPCTRIGIFYNSSYLTEFIPVGATWSDMNINEAIAPTEDMAKRLKTYFPNVNVSVVPPIVSGVFRESDEPKKLIVNIVSKNQEFVNRLVKPFYWKYPAYKWVSFRDLRGMSQEVFADALREGAITVWCDEDSDLGLSGIDAIKSGSILIAKLPSRPKEWMLKDDDFRNDVLWFDDIEGLHAMVASVVRAWTKDEIPSEMLNVYETFKNMYTAEVHDNSIKLSVVDGIFDKIKNYYIQILSSMKNKQENGQENE